MKIADINEVSTFLEIKVSTIYSWVSHNKIPFYKINGLIRFDIDEITLWLSKNRCQHKQVSKSSAKNTSLGIDHIIKNAIDDYK